MSASAQQIFDTAPLGAMIRFSDNTPQPPARFTKKLEAWKIRNGVGRLTRKSPGTVSSIFTLHLGDFHGVISMSRVYPVDTNLSFEVIEAPHPGMVRIVEKYGDIKEMLHLAENSEEAEQWLMKNHHHRNTAFIEVVI